MAVTGFTAQAQKKAEVKDCTLTDQESGYVFRVVANNPIYLNSTNGHMCGGLAGDYIKLPAVPKRSITEIQIMYPRK